MKPNITMIGMPSSGKSTVGVLLAKRLGFSFVDVDIVIQEKEGRLLKEIIAGRWRSASMRDWMCSFPSSRREAA